MWIVLQGILQVLTELGWGVINQGIGELSGKAVAGMMRTDKPLAHGQSFYAGGGNHVASAGIHKHLQESS